MVRLNRTPCDAAKLRTASCFCALLQADDLSLSKVRARNNDVSSATEVRRFPNALAARALLVDHWDVSLSFFVRGRAREVRRSF